MAFLVLVTIDIVHMTQKEKIDNEINRYYGNLLEL
jgi:hypothetical protein